MNLLLASAENWILPGILLVLCIVLFVLYYFRNKKYQQNADQMSNNLKKGDKVKTYSGVYGTIIEIVQKDDGKIVTIETGTEKHKSYVSYDIRAVYAINEPEKPVEEKVDEKPVEEKPVQKTEEKKEKSKNDEKPVEEQKVEDAVAEEKPIEEKKPRKPRAKKQN